MPSYREQLREIRTFPQLIKFLRDELDWPVASDDFEDLTFDYTPEELGIEPETAAKIQEIKRLRPLSTNQPWGIFFLKFEPKRLPVVALRRILSRVVLKKRASANSDERTAWQAEDLLFISNYGEDEERRISFAHFSEDGQARNLPTLKVLGWDNLDTALHLDAVSETLTTKLAWPNNENDVDTWRRNWRSAFTLRHREVITTSKQLSIRLAELARAIRDRIRTVLDIETETGPLSRLMKAFQEALIHDLDAAGFADMYAQTIAYGLLSARIADPHSKTADDFAAHMRTNPFLKELMQTFLRAGGRHSQEDEPGIDFDELGVSEVIDLLDDAYMEAVLRDFGDRNPQEDPVIHFYEHFLAAYDKKQKMRRGVFYTPRPVVSYIVRSVDELLRTEFGLEDGLADTTTWGEMAKRHPDIKIPEGVPPDQAFVQILDPACGTGTFLVEVIDLIHKTMAAKWKGQGHNLEAIEALWNEYVPNHLLPRLHGYELLMAPYAIAHLKIGLKLYETGYRFGSEERARIYLTNTLEPAHDFSGRFEFAIPALAHEAQAVNAIKRRRRFTVVIGNPPYAKSSSNRTDAAEALVAEYKRLVYGETNVQPLSDDYVKFLSYALQISVPSASVIGMITNRSYLEGLIHRGMRSILCSSCSGIFIVDLHGDSNVGEHSPLGRANENVFDIMQGVAISMFVRSPRDRAKSVFRREVWGKRDEKYRALNQADAQTDRLVLPVSEPYWFFAPKDLGSQSEQVSWVSVDSLFRIGGMGAKSRRDHFLIDERREVLRERFAKLASTRNVESLRSELQVTDNPQWTLDGMRELVRREGVDERLVTITYRPFDVRYIWYHRQAIERGDARWPVMRHVLPAGLSLLTSRQSANHDFSSAFVARGLSEMKTSESTRGSYVFPIRRVEKSELLQADGGTSNLRANALGAFLSTRTPEDVLSYIYSVLHSATYRARYAGALRIEFPKIPKDCQKDLAVSLIRFGGELVALHLMESPKLDYFITTYMGPKNPEVERVGWSDDTVWLDAAATKKGEHATPGTIGFRCVPEAVWNFHIGGYQVCHKWLKDRKGRTLSDDDLVHYQKIVVALNETIRLMREIDEVIERHGGWPGAFQSASTEDGESAQTLTASEKSTEDEAKNQVSTFRPQIVEPQPDERYVTCVPVIPLKAAAGAFSDPQHVEDDNWDWVAVETNRRLRPGMFVAQVVGKSMEPAIPDGAWCLFAAPVTGTRQGKTVLVQLRDATDPETGQRYTVKRYESEKSKEGDTWRHTKITLKPLNRDFAPIILIGTEEDQLQVIAEFIEVLR